MASAMAAFIPSGVLSWEQAEPDVQPWGEIRKYFIGETSGCRDMFSAVAKVNPGMELHPPQAHLEEEFLVILSGNARWHYEGKESPAKAGDVLYVAPWMLHGITNTGAEPLVFFVSKWIGREDPLVPKTSVRK